jgi:hypothetical protein
VALEKWGRKDEFIQAMSRKSHSVHSRRFYEVALRKVAQFCGEKKIGEASDQNVYDVLNRFVADRLWTVYGMQQHEEQLEQTAGDCQPPHQSRTQPQVWHEDANDIPNVIGWSHSPSAIAYVPRERVRYSHPLQASCPFAISSR